MSFKYGILSFLVFCIVLFLILKNYEIWTQPIEWAPEKSMAKKSERNIEIKPGISTTEAQKDSSSIKSYIGIAEKNIFNPERKDFPLPMATEAKKPIVRPQIVLYGVTMVGDYQAASIVNPGRPLRKGERETITLRVGEQIGEYKLAKISSDRITLEAEGDSYEVLLYDPKIPKKRMEVKTEAKPAAVTSTQPVPVPSPRGSPVPTQPSATGEAVKPAPSPSSVPKVFRPSVPSSPSSILRGRRRMVPSPSGAPAQPISPAPQEIQEPTEEEEE
jgi:hypothetical protein